MALSRRYVGEDSAPGFCCPNRVFQGSQYHGRKQKYSLKKIPSSIRSHDSHALGKGAIRDRDENGF